MCYFVFFFFNDTATTEIYTLSLHDALPIWLRGRTSALWPGNVPFRQRSGPAWRRWPQDRKSTRLNSSHANISYAVFCLKKKKKKSQYSVCNRFTVTQRDSSTNIITCVI